MDRAEDTTIHSERSLLVRGESQGVGASGGERDSAVEIVGDRKAVRLGRGAIHYGYRHFLSLVNSNDRPWNIQVIRAAIHPFVGATWIRVYNDETCSWTVTGGCISRIWRRRWWDIAAINLSTLATAPEVCNIRESRTNTGGHNDYDN